MADVPRTQVRHCPIRPSDDSDPPYDCINVPMRASRMNTWYSAVGQPMHLAAVCGVEAARPACRL